MSGLRDWLPASPGDGPPLPRWMVQVSKSSPAPQPPQPPEEIATRPGKKRVKKGLDDMVLIMRPRNQDPVWLAQYREKFRAASKIALVQTAHLVGKTERAPAINRIIGDLIKQKKV